MRMSEAAQSASTIGDDSVARTLYRIEFEEIDNTRWQIFGYVDNGNCYRGKNDWGKTFLPLS